MVLVYWPYNIAHIIWLILYGTYNIIETDKIIWLIRIDPESGPKTKTAAMIMKIFVANYMALKII